MARLLQSLDPLQPTRQEKASGFLLALLLWLGSLTLFMLAAWFSHQRDEGQRPVTRIALRGEQDRASGSPGEAASTLPDQNSDDHPAPTEISAERLTTVASLVASEFEGLDGAGKGIGNEIGDGRKKGPGGPGGNVIPSWERWQIRFSASNVQEYAAMLDYFQVELGVVGRQGKIDYARNLSHSRPVTRQGDPAAESRLHFLFQSGELKDADRELAKKAGLSTAGWVICQFYPDPIQSDLARLERQSLGERPLSSVRRTVFGVRRTGSGYQFFVERLEPERFSGGLSPL